MSSPTLPPAWRRISIPHMLMHDLTVADFESGSVFSSCSGESLALDFHKGGESASHESS
jgi:hypothetical protein